MDLWKSLFSLELEGKYDWITLCTEIKRRKSYPHNSHRRGESFFLHNLSTGYQQSIMKKIGAYFMPLEYQKS